MIKAITWPGWETVRQIGAGSYGKVYEIQRDEFGRNYKAAMKVISVPQSETDIDYAYCDGMDQQTVVDYYQDFVRSLSDEFALMAELKGFTNIVSYEDHLILPHEDGIGWDVLIRMELLTPLHQWVREHPLEEEDVIRLGRDICQALILCEEKNIIHRDIKPENIFINSHGDFKLGDFGIARTVEKTISSLSIKGTYTYMAPEIYLGKEYGTTVDLYSLATVLYRYLNANRTPFMPMGGILFSDQENALKARMSGQPVPEPACGGARLKAVILKALAFDPEDRYQSAREFQDALARCAASPTTQPDAPEEDPEEKSAEDTEEESAQTGELRREDLPRETSVLGEAQRFVPPMEGRAAFNKGFFGPYAYQFGGKYKPLTVTFLDGDGKCVATKEVGYGESVVPPKVDAKHFIGWYPSIPNVIIRDQVFQARYETTGQYDSTPDNWVKFIYLDDNGTYLGFKSFLKGSAVTHPYFDKLYSKPGRTFAGWEPDVKIAAGRMVCRARYVNSGQMGGFAGAFGGMAGAMPAAARDTGADVRYAAAPLEKTTMDPAGSRRKSGHFVVRVKTGERFSIMKSPFCIGRNFDSELCIGDNTAIGRRHALIVCQNGEYYLVDQNSTNHTYLNNKLLSPNVKYRLERGVGFRLANEQFLFE